MADPGAIGSQVPPGDDEVWRRIKALEAATQQALAQAASAQALLAVANAQLALAANQVSPAVGSASTGSFTFGTAFATILSFTLTVPAGYTQAVITSSGVVAAGSPAGNDTLTARTNVGGVSNAGSLSFCAAAIGQTTTPCFGSNTFTGLVGGQLIAVALQAHWATGASATGLLTAQVAATCIFLK